MGLFVLTGLLESFVTYIIDESGVVRQGWNGRKEMRWADVVQVNMSGQKDATIKLRDALGTELTIHRLFISKDGNNQMNSLLGPYLAPILERQTRDFGSLDTVYTHKRALGWLGAFMAVLIGCMIALFFLTPHQTSDDAIAWILIPLMLLMFLVPLALMLYGFSYRLTITSIGLVESSVFKKKEIPFHHVTSVGSRMVATKNSSFELTTIEDDNQKININSNMKDYSILLEYIKKRVSEGAKETGEVKAEEVTEKQKQQQRKMLPIVAGIYALLFIGIGVWMLKEGNTKLEHYRLLEVQGVQTRGEVTGRDMRGSKSTTYYIDYQFKDANGVTQRGESPVQYDDYANARIGQPAQVIYVPGRNDVGMLSNSIGKSKAENNVRMGYFNIALGFVAPGLILFSMLRNNKKSTKGDGNTA